MVDKSQLGHVGILPLLSSFKFESVPWIERLLDPLGIEARKRTLAWILVFVAYLLTAQIGAYLYIDMGTSPALIWPPVGIALAAVLMEGYWIVTAIAVAALTHGLLMPSVPLFIVFGSVVANTIQPLAGGFVLRKMHFNPLMNTLRDVFLLISVACIATAIMPLMNLGFASIYNFFSEIDRQLPPWPTLWLGGALSALVLIPFLARWIRTDFTHRKRLHQLEAIVSASIVVILSYVIFATKLPQPVATGTFLALLGGLCWIAFRAGPRIMALSLLSMTAISIAGALYGVHAPSQSGIEPTLSQRLITNEMLDLVLCFFFFILVSVEEQRKEMVKRLQKEAQQLESAILTIKAEEKAKNDFIAILAHELRNPLAPIISGLELLILDESVPQRLEILQSAQRQSHVMRRLLDELLDVARITKHSITLKKEDVSLQSVLKHSIEGVQYFYRERNQSFSNSMPKEDVWVNGDPVRLAQIFTNLLYNAGKYTQTGGKIRLTLEKKGSLAVVSLTDSGVGIQKDMLSNIFEPFVQNHKPTSVGTGLGIGLSIAKRLVKLHGGRIYAESEGEGQGSTFTVELPLVKSPTEKLSVPYSSITETLSILIVDDNIDAAENVAKLLRTRGHTTNVVYTGRDALKELLKKPNVALLDIGLPDINGYEIARQMRAYDPSIAIIALSGYSSEHDKPLAKSAGVDLHITKPASLADIEAAIFLLRSKALSRNKIPSSRREELHQR